jgi:hypothetical protein
MSTVVIGIVIVTAGDIVFSLWGDGSIFPKPGSVNVNIGYQREWAGAESLALKRLAEAVARNPQKRFFTIRWVESPFLGWFKENQDFIEYDRQTGGLVEANNSPLVDEPNEEWDGVRESLLPGLAKNGFQSRFLQNSGCHSDLD